MRVSCGMFYFHFRMCIVGLSTLYVPFYLMRKRSGIDVCGTNNALIDRLLY
jgi:hypothetical protein